MSQTQIQINVDQAVKQIPFFEKLDYERGKRISQEVTEKLKFAMDLEIHELRVLPTKFMVIPGLQRFGMARYKFAKFLGKDYILYADRDIAIQYYADKVELYIRARRTNKIYHKYYDHEWELPDILRPRYSDLTEDNAEPIEAITKEDIVREIFSLSLDLDQYFVLKQGHLYAVPILRQKNIEKWIVESDVRQIFNHRIMGYDNVALANALTPEIFYLKSDKIIVIESKDHGTNFLPAGEYILYHPEDVD